MVRQSGKGNLDNPARNAQSRDLLMKVWASMSPAARVPYQSTPLPHPSNAMQPDEADDKEFVDEQDNSGHVVKAVQKSHLQKLLNTASPETLEEEVQKGMQLLAKLADPFSEQASKSPDAAQWLQ